jgi:hypothetical protein
MVTWTLLKVVCKYEYIACLDVLSYSCQDIVVALSVAASAQHKLQYYGPAATGIWRTHVELHALYPTSSIAGRGVETENIPSFMVFAYVRSDFTVSNVTMIMNCELEKVWMEPSWRLSEGAVDNHKQASLRIAADTQFIRGYPVAQLVEALC